MQERQRPPLRRPVDGRWVAGACTGVAAHLRLPVRAVRIGFVAATAAAGVGVVAYLLLWAAVPSSGPPPRAELAPDLQVLAEAGDVDAAVAAVTTHRPDVVLLDVHLPGGAGGGGAEVLRRCAGVTTGAGGPVRFLALSVSDAAQDVLSVIRAGARGYVTKAVDGGELSEAVRKVAEGDAVFSPRLAGFVLDAFGTGAADLAVVDDELDRLTVPEREVMRLIARGYAYREVGKELFISVETVESHVSSVLRKLQLSSRHELTRWAVDRRRLI